MIVDHNYKKEIPNEIVIWDETLRDGEQAPGVAFSVEQKTVLAKMLDDIGVKIIDAGFPAVSLDEQEAIRQISKLDLRAQVGVTVRANKADIDCAVKCGVRTIYMFAPTSKLHITYKFGVDYKALMAMVFEAIEYASALGLETYFISEDTSRSDFDFIIPFFDDLYEAGIRKVIITDTIGIMLPSTMKCFVKMIIDSCNPEIDFGIHCHNDFGLATANTLSAIEAGITYPTVTVNGIGERAGNASFEEVVVALECAYKYKTGICLSKISELSQMVELFSGLPLSPCKPIVGYNAFRHESGVHVNSLLKNLETYEPIAPELVGRSRELVFGKHTGRTLIRHVLRQMGHNCDEALVEHLLVSVKAKAVNTQKDFIYTTVNEYYRHHLGITDQKLKTMLSLELYASLIAK